MSDGGTEIWFYHLERKALDQALPGLLEKTLERGWRALIKSADRARLDEVGRRLWTWRDDAFLAHGAADAPHADRQPILLSESGDNLNGAQALFIIDDAELGPTEAYQRCFILFDGQDEQATARARTRWKTLKDAGAALSYWRQDADGRWEKAA